MSNAAALLKRRSGDVGDGVYLERADRREPVTEEYLRALVARLPRLLPDTFRLRRFLARANALEEPMRALDTARLAAVLTKAGADMRGVGFADEPLARSFAAVREAARRTLGMRHHDVQLFGGWALLQGRIAEMQTGEGKTLVATLAACAAAATGAAVHIVTVNDYLADRDAKTNAPLYDFFGLSTGAIAQGMAPAERRTQYARDIVYVSNKEIVFDYMKDRIAAAGVSAAHYRLRRLYGSRQPATLLLRGLHVAIVDEADSVLIDEARTPLIISQTRAEEASGEPYRTALAFARGMQRGEHFEITMQRDVRVTAAGERFARERAATLSGVWTSALWRSELLQKALTALWCFQRDRDYIVADGKVNIVDEFTGRVMPDRAWEHGLHQMIEMKEDCEITGARATLSRMTYQRFFRRYLLLCGMTGTAKEVGAELRRVYDLEVTKIPTNRPVRRVRLPSRAYVSGKARWRAVAERAIAIAGAGRAVLIGTRSVDASERLSALLTERGVAHAVLNARQDKQEAEIVAAAGRRGRITVATNMAGRGTDIKLDPEVQANGGLHVILTEFHESRRIDRQLFGRCARQGEPGSVEALVSLEDDLLQRNATRSSAAAALAARDGTIAPWLLGILVRYAQSIAESRNVRIRLATLKQDRKLQRLLAFSGTAE